MNNLWTYKKPTKPGLYLCNRGDVVTEDSLIGGLRGGSLPAILLQFDGELLSDEEGIAVRDYRDSFKFIPHHPDMDIDYLSSIGNGD